MKETIYIKKYIDKDSDLEYIDPLDIFNYYREDDEKGQFFYYFLIKVAEYLHYFNNNTSTAFGNPDYEKIGGVVLGWCLGAKWQMVETREHIVIYSTNGKKKIMVIEKPKISKAETDKRKELQKMWHEIL